MPAYKKPQYRMQWYVQDDRSGAQVGDTCRNRAAAIARGRSHSAPVTIFVDWGNYYTPKDPPVVHRADAATAEANG